MLFMGVGWALDFEFLSWNCAFRVFVFYLGFSKAFMKQSLRFHSPSLFGVCSTIVRLWLVNHPELLNILKVRNSLPREKQTPIKFLWV